MAGNRTRASTPVPPPDHGAPRSARLRWLAWALLAASACWASLASAQTADLSIIKSDGSDVYTAGDEVTYEIVVSNAGPDDAVAASVEDPLPAGTGPGAWTCATTAGTATCGQAFGVGDISTTVDLYAGGQVTFSYTVGVPAGFVGPLINTATVEPPAGTTDNVPGNNAATDTNQPAPTVQLAKVSLGGTGMFTYTMANLSNGADTITTVTDGDALPSAQMSTVIDVAAAVTITEAASDTFVLDGATCVDANVGDTGNPPSFGSLSGNVLTIAPANLLPGAQILCTFTNRIGVDVALTKTATPTSLRTGEVAVFTLTLTNNGPGDAEDVLLTDMPGTGLDCTAPGPTATCSASGGASCPAATVPVADLLAGGVNIPGLPMGGQVEVVVQCQVIANGQ
jgi:uncharacterized repeat protein (TIGR01451 family)